VQGLSVAMLTGVTVLVRGEATYRVFSVTHRVISREIAKQLIRIT
jgi:hypothetical protein